MAQNVVRTGGLFHPPRIEFCEFARAIDRFLDAPALIGVHHELVGAADFIANEGGATQIVRGLAANLQLEVSPAFGESLVA